MGLILSLGTFCPWDIFLLSLGTFCPWDVLSLGRFVPWDILSLGRFVLGRFNVLGRFVCAFYGPQKPTIIHTNLHFFPEASPEAGGHLDSSALKIITFALMWVELEVDFLDFRELCFFHSPTRGRQWARYNIHTSLSCLVGSVTEPRRFGGYGS